MFYLNIELPLIVKEFIQSFRWSIVGWLPNFFKESQYYCFVYTFKFEQNSLACGFWRNIGSNIDFWFLLLFYKVVVFVVSRCFTEHKNWYIVKFKRANERLDLQFLWRLVDAHLPEVLLYIFLYLKIYMFSHPVSSDIIGVWVFIAIYLFYMIYTNIVLIMFMKRLTPTLLTEDEAKEKKLHSVLGLENEKKDSEKGAKVADIKAADAGAQKKQSEAEKGKKPVFI